MTRQRLILSLVVLAGASLLYIWWTHDPDREAIQRLLDDVRAAAEAGDWEPVLPAFRQDFTFSGSGSGSGGAAVVTYNRLAEMAGSYVHGAGVERLQVRNLHVERDGEHAVVAVTVDIESRDRMASARPIPLRIELTQTGDEASYRGWRIYRAELSMPLGIGR